MLFTLFSWACAIATLTAFLYKLPALLSNAKNLAIAALCTYFLCNSIAYFVDLEGCREKINELLGFPNATTIVVQVSVVVLTAAQQITVVNLTLPARSARRSTRWLALGFGMSIVVLVTLFFMVQPSREAAAQETIYLNLHDTGYALYFTYYLTVCTAGRIQTVLFAFRYARTAPECWLRLGMWSVAGGSALILVYCGVRYWQILALHTDGVVEPWKFLFWFIADSGTLLQIFGWTVPSWGPRVGALGRWLNSYRSYVRLAPLWRGVYGAAPGIALEHPSSRLLAWLPPRPLDYHLYRRVIEIRDAELILRQAADPISLHRLDQAYGMPHEALCEAAVLRSALRAGLGAPRSAGATQQGPSARRRSAGTGLQQEIAALIQVSNAFQALDRRAPAGKGSRPR
ncbi:MAB_1171c family putative transporter [Streptomyces sp. NPDC059894]|uniref:MAB_1171c family putative transporter n=1 Tax=unclassified Streptomyces TaxID=2593676 RepID=UPI003652A42D